MVMVLKRGRKGRERGNGGMMRDKKRKQRSDENMEWRG
jgi:hypothetical protein